MSAPLALPAPPGPDFAHRIHIVHEHVDGGCLHLVRLPWDEPLEQSIAVLRHLHHLAVDRGEQLRVMRGVVEIDVRNSDLDPETAVGSLAWLEQVALEETATVLEQHVPVDGMRSCGGCAWRPRPWTDRPRPRQWARHLAQVLADAGRLR